VAIRPECGIKVPIKNRKQVIEGLAAGIRTYEQDRECLAAHGKAARQTILEFYDWDKKGVQMNQVYEETVRRARVHPVRNQDPIRYSRRLISFRSVVVAATTLLLIGTLGFLSLSHLKHEAALIVHDTMPGLSYAGEANAYIADSSRTLLYVTEKDPARRRQIREQMNVLSSRTSKYLSLYRQSIFSDEDVANFQSLVQIRNSYIRVRNQVLELADAGRETEALAVFNESLLPAHAEVKKAGDHLFEYNMKQGRDRGQRIMTFCTVNQIALGVASVVIFLLGFFFGLFK